MTVVELNFSLMHKVGWEADSDSGGCLSPLQEVQGRSRVEVTGTTSPTSKVHGGGKRIARSKSCSNTYKVYRTTLLLD